MYLREMLPEDAPGLYELYGDEEVTRYMEPLFPDIREEQAYMESYYENVYCFYGYGLWLITLKDGTIIGRAGVELLPGDDQVPEGYVRYRYGGKIKNGGEPEAGEHVLGYMLGKPYWHKGYAAEACRAILEYAGELGIREITALIHQDNIASIRLAEKLGFVCS